VTATSPPESLEADRVGPPPPFDEELARALAELVRPDAPVLAPDTIPGVWDRNANEVGWSALLGAARGGPDVSPYAAPARATDLSGLPPAYIDAGSAETFRDEDVAYASRIWRAGGTAELHVWPGGFHGFEGAVPQAALSRDAKAAVTDWLRRLLRD
jgi:acetyl esterase/lipase